MADAALALQSSLIGSIYDCALDPDLWPATLRRLCEVFGRNVPMLQKFSGYAKTAGSAQSMWRSWKSFTGLWTNAAASPPSP
jgi:hypothetical protein